MQIETINGTRVAFYDGPPIASEADANDIIGATYGLEVDVIAVPAERFVDDFFWLRSGLAGAVLQKLQQYGFRFAVLGDISRFTAESPSLRDLVHESNRHGQTLFLADRAALEARLSAGVQR
jgi:hypothetical protein